MVAASVLVNYDFGFSGCHAGSVEGVVRYVSDCVHEHQSEVLLWEHESAAVIAIGLTICSSQRSYIYSNLYHSLSSNIILFASLVIEDIGILIEYISRRKFIKNVNSRTAIQRQTVL